MSNEGWICPKCGRVWSPMWPSCSDCNQQRLFDGFNKPQATTLGACDVPRDESLPADAGEDA